MSYNEAYYLANNPDVAIAVNQGLIGTGWQHFNQYGQSEGRSYAAPNDYEFFNETYYLANNSDVAKAVQAGAGVGTGWHHYQLFGKAEGRQYLTPEGYDGFSEENYLLNNADVALAVNAGVFGTGWEHYQLFGRAENRSYAQLAERENSGFDEDLYLANNPDVAKAVEAGVVVGSGWHHYKLAGSQEGRTFSKPANYDNTSQGAYKIEIQYSGDIKYKTYVDQAANLYQTMITSELPRVGDIDDIRINVTVESMGDSNLLGNAGPTELRPGTFLPYLGEITLNLDNIENQIKADTFLDTVIHEMAHVLGFGTLWQEKGLNPVFGSYTGANALREYKSLLGQSATPSSIPLETGGGEGTANVHWAESVFSGEMMTGWGAESGRMPFSRMTVASLEDLGYSVNYAVADPYSLPQAKVALVGGADGQVDFLAA